MKLSGLLWLIFLTALLHSVAGHRLGRDVPRVDGEPRHGSDVPPVVRNVGRFRFVGKRDGRIFWNPLDPPPFVSNENINDGWRTG